MSSVTARGMIALTRPSTHFLVKYNIDNQLQVREKKHFLSVTADAQILVDETHSVQWGTSKKICNDAVVLGMGDKNEMLAMQDELKNCDNDMVSNSTLISYVK
jgi:hypothetical protein